MWKQWKQKHMRKGICYRWYEAQRHGMADCQSQFDNKMCLLIFRWLVDGLQQIQKLPLVDAALRAAHARNENVDCFETTGDAMEGFLSDLSGCTRYIY